MIIRMKQMIGYLGVSTLALAAAGSAFATDETINVEAQFRIAITLTEVNQVDFTPGSGSIDYTGTITSADCVRLNTNDTLETNGDFSTSLTAGSAGEITIAGEASTGVSISCTSSGVQLSDNAGTPVLLDMDQLHLEVNATGTGTNYAGRDYTCAGAGTSAYTSYTLNGSGAGTILLGGRILGTGSMPSAVYTTSNSGGTPVTVRVIYTP